MTSHDDEVHDDDKDEQDEGGVESDVIADAHVEEGVASSPRTPELHLVRLIQRRMGPDYVQNGMQLSFGERANVTPEKLLDVLRFLKRDPDADLELLVDICCVDRLDVQEKGEDAALRVPRFEIIYLLRSVRLPYQLSLHLESDDETPEVPSVTGIYAAADWHERALWDLFGIYIDGHSHLRRLLLYPGFTSHPMRRDYPSSKTQPLVPLRRPRRQPVVIQADGSRLVHEDTP